MMQMTFEMETSRPDSQRRDFSKNRLFCDLDFLQKYNLGKPTKTEAAPEKITKGLPLEKTNIESLRALLPEISQFGSSAQRLLFNSPQNERHAPEAILEFAWEQTKIAKGRLLIMDCNLRMPTLNETYHLRPTVGLSEYLLGTHAVHETIMSTNLNNIYLMQAGLAQVDPVQLLMSNRLPRLLRVVSKHFDYILVNSPPYDDAIDAFVLAKYIRPVVLLVSGDSKDHKLGIEAEDIRSELAVLNLSVFQIHNRES